MVECWVEVRRQLVGFAGRRVPEGVALVRKSQYVFEVVPLFHGLVRACTSRHDGMLGENKLQLTSRGVKSGSAENMTAQLAKANSGALNIGGYLVNI
jgi:hypothetical protein